MIEKTTSEDGLVTTAEDSASGVAVRVQRFKDDDLGPDGKTKPTTVTIGAAKSGASVTVSPSCAAAIGAVVAAALG